MTPARDHASPEGLPTLLRRELQLDALRIHTIARIAAGAVIAVTVAMVFQIPLPAYVAYLIFLLSQEDTASTLISAIGGLVAVTLAVALSLLFYVFDASAPALRIPLLALSTFIGMFLSRTSTLGPIIFLSGFVLVLSQTLIDHAPSTEVITHIVLWLWVVVAIPVFTVMVLNLLTGQSPVSLSRQRAASLMDAVADYIELPRSHNPSLLRDKLLELDKLKGKAFLWNKKLRAFAEEDQRLMGLMLEILQIARALPPELATASRRSLALSIRDSRAHFLQRRGIDTATVPVTQDDEAYDFTFEALRKAVMDLHAVAGGSAEPSTPNVRAASGRKLLVADAFTNPAHVHYALKVTFAVLAAYATYSLLDWPGISTAVTTCFFVSLATLGQSVHKLTLRLSGAILGGVIGGLCLVFVIPSLTDIGQLCLLIAGASVLFAWVSTSSENFSYAGMQMAFAFFLGVLQGHAPASDLTVLRDRVVGILVGNIWISIFFTSLWPVSALQQTRDLWSASLKKLSELLVAPTAKAAEELRLEINAKAQQAALLKSRSTFEGQLLKSRRPAHTAELEADAIERVTSSAFILRRLQSIAPPSSNADVSTSQRLLALSKGEVPISPRLHIPDPTSFVDRARSLLNDEIDHATRLL